MDMVGFSSYIHLLYVIEEEENCVVKIIGIKMAEFRIVKRYSPAAWIDWISNVLHSLYAQIPQHWWGSFEEIVWRVSNECSAYCIS